MTSRDFCYWLQGYFEIVGGKDSATPPLTIDQADLIKRHLAMVFIHEIDPSMPDPKLDEAHAAKPAPKPSGPFGGNGPGGALIRC